MFITITIYSDKLYVWIFFIGISLVSYLKLPMSVSVLEFSVLPEMAAHRILKKAQKINVITLGYCQPFARGNQSSQTVNYFP